MTNHDNDSHGGQQGSTKHGGKDPEETKVGNNAMDSTKPGGGTERRKGEDFEETDEQKRGGDADNPSETTGGTETGGEDKGAKQ